MGRIKIEKMSHSVLVLVLVCMGFILYLYGNNKLSLTHPDEVFYTQSAKEMVAHDSWLTPMIFDEAQFEKPIMFYFMMASLIKVFGLTPAVARFWPGFFGILGLGVTYWIAWMMFKKKRIAFLSGLILGTSFIYLALSRAVLTDVVFSIWVTIALGFFYFAYRYEDKRTFGTIMFFVVTALAVLTKGLLGITFIFTPALLLLVYNKDLRLLKNRSVWFGFLLFLAIAMPWHILMYRDHGSWFIEEYFNNVHIRRLFVTEHQKINKWFFYPALMIVGVIPWVFVSIPAWIAAIKKVVKKDVYAGNFFFLLAWTFSVFIYVQPAQCKLASYIFPMFPAIAIMIAAYLEDVFEWVETGHKSMILYVCGFIASFVLLGVSASAIIFGNKYIDILVSMKPMYILSAITFFVSATMLILNLKRKHVAMMYFHVSITATLLFCLIFAIPYAEPWVSCKEVSERFNKIDQSDSVVLASKFYVRGVRFYTDRDVAVIAIRDKGFFSPHPIPFLNDKSKVMDFLSTQDTTYAIVKDGDVEQLNRFVKGRLYTIEQLYGKAGKFILRINKIKPLRKY